MNFPDYRPKTPYFPWQEAALRHSTASVPSFATAPYVGFFFDPRMGKTKAALDRTAILYHQGEVDALLVVASPNGIHRNWVNEEIPLHLPDDVPRQCLIWQSGKHKQVGYALEMRALLAFEGLAVLATNAEALHTPALREYLGKFVRRRRVHFVADEVSHWGRNIGSSMKTANSIKSHAPYRTLLDGTPEGESPLDYYAEMGLLSKDIFGFKERSLFNAYFAEWEERENRRTGGTFRVVKKYRHLDELKAKVQLYTYRAFRPDDWLKPTNEVVGFNLTFEQRQVYDRLREQYEIELAGEDRRIVAHVLTRYLRLQQIASNYLPGQTTSSVCDGCLGEGCDRCSFLGVTVETSALRRIGAANPRLDALRSIIQGEGGPFIVWTRFHFDVDEVLSLARRLRLRPVRFDGTVPEEERIAGRRAFQEGTSQLLVGTPTTGGRGQPMHRVGTMVYYSNDYSRLTREQSECRGDHPMRTNAMHIVDLVARDTVDESIQAAHRAKRRLADLIMDRRGSEGRWLR
jgi:Mesyanzhinovviridae DNA helicase